MKEFYEFALIVQKDQCAVWITMVLIGMKSLAVAQLDTFLMRFKMITLSFLLKLHGIQCMKYLLRFS